MDDIIVEEVGQFVTFLKQLADSGQPVSISRQFNLPILNVLWRITVGHRFEYTDPKLLDIIQRMVAFLQQMGQPVSLLSLTHPWIFKGRFRNCLFHCPFKNFI